MTELTFSEFQSLSINYYITLISFTLLTYDYWLTFTMEVERFWKTKQFTWAVFFFYLNRYLTLFGHLPVIFEFFWYSTADSKHKNLQSYHQYFAVAVQVWIATLLIMRMYALYDRSRKVLALFLVVAVAVVIVACWSIFTGKNGHTTEYFLPMGCPAPVSRDAASRLGAAWGGLLVFDTLVFVMTVYQSILLRQAGLIDLLTLMLRDGSIYFGVMIVSNIANILTFVYGNLFTRGAVTTFTNIISSIMITRLMLNLRDPKLVLGPQRSASTGRPRCGTREVVSTFVDFRTQITEFTDPDAAQWSHHYNARFSGENEYQGPTRSAELGIELISMNSTAP